MLPDGPRAPPLWVTARWLTQPYRYFEACQRRHGDAFTLRGVAFPPTVVVSHPDAVRDVFSAEPTVLSSSAYNVEFGEFLGRRSMFVLDGERHALHRRLIAPALARAQVEDRVREIANAAIDGWEERRVLSLYEGFRAITLRVVLRALLGEAPVTAFEDVVAAAARLVDLGSNPWLLLPALRRELGGHGPWARLVAQRRVLDAMVDREIADRRASPRGDLLSSLAAPSGELDDEEIRDEALTLLVAGHETTATALTWSMRWLLEHEGVRQRLLSELDAGGSTLLDAVVREALRLLPVVPSAGRLALAPATIGSLELPKGVAVLTSIYLAGRRADSFVDPESFLPDRFLDKHYSAYQWFPFGGGARRCVGMHFALHEMKVVLAAVLRRVSLRLVPGYHPRAVRRGVTVAPARGLPVVVERTR